MTRACTRGCPGTWGPSAGPYCPTCAWPLRAVADGRAQPQRVRPASPAPVPLDQLMRSHSEVKRYRWCWPALYLPVDADVTLRGPPGCGKSTAATAMALDLAHQGVDVFYASVEEGVESQARERFARVARLAECTFPRRLLVGSGTTITDIARDVRKWSLDTDSPGVVVIDSLSALHGAQPLWSALQASPHGSVLVQHVVTSGAAKGGLEAEFGGDVCIVIAQDGTAVIEKSRWGPTGAEFAFNARCPPPIERGLGEVVPMPKREP